MRARFNKAAFFAGRVKYGCQVPPAPLPTSRVPGEGQYRAAARLHAVAETEALRLADAPVAPPSRQRLRRVALVEAKWLRKLRRPRHGR